jgi:aspartyl-tRNA(Asn)/glutamyl-tRNA(Gln) amidotransferase subunit B
MRSKEDAHDYRYFPDPDLLPLEVSQAWVDQVRRALPELPGAKRARFRRELGLSAYEASALTTTRELADFFEALVRALGGAYKLAASWVLGEFSAALNRSGIDVLESPVSSDRLAGLLKNIEGNQITRRSASEVFDEMWGSSMDADVIIESRGLKQISDSGEIERIVETIVAANPSQVAEFRAGKEKAFNFFVGQVMKASRGKANPAQVNEILRRKLLG